MITVIINSLKAVVALAVLATLLFVLLVTGIIAAIF